MLATAKNLSLIEQKRLQWAREREEMVGLYGLWGRPKNIDNDSKFYHRNNLLPPIEGKPEHEEPIIAEESETSGYLSDSPKHITEKEQHHEHYINDTSQEINNDNIQEKMQCWSEKSNKAQENYWAEKKMYKNYKNETWAHQNTDVNNRERFFRSNRNYWYGTPESLSSDDGARLRWGDRGIGIGHLWEPVINQPECRLPLVADPYRQTPKWVEKGLKNSDGNKADILIIHHPDEDFDQPQKNFLLGQNAPIPPEVIEERERKRKKAIEHQNAIKKQLEEREMKRKQERENRLREEKLEEERIKKEQEIERIRYEEEQKKIKQKEEIEKKKEEVMREAIEVAEKRAKEEKKQKKFALVDTKNESGELTDRNNRKLKTPRFKRAEESERNKSKKEESEKTLKDSSSQFEEMSLAQNFQLLNVNGLPVESGLALMLDTPQKDNFLLPPEGLQLALLMSPGNAAATTQVSTESFVPHIGQRILTPSKYRLKERQRCDPSSKSTQTDMKYMSPWTKNDSRGTRVKKHVRRCATNSGSSGGSQKCVHERRHKHNRNFFTTKYRSESLSLKHSLENRPKWGINRPTVQYKKQSEKDPYYQKKIKERLKKAEVEILSVTNLKPVEKEKEMDSVVRLLDCQTDEDEKQVAAKEEHFLQNGYRMNSNLSSPVFVPIAPRHKKSDLDSERSRSNESEQFESVGNEDNVEDEENTPVPGSVGFLTQTQLETIKQITSLREGLKKLQKDYSNSRSITPFSDKSVEK